MKADTTKHLNFYPRSPCGERLKLSTTLSITIIFLSTLSLRRATGCQRLCGHPTTNFYPRSPCGERQWTPWNSPVLCYFYPRSPCGERHKLPQGRNSHNIISIHALLAESDTSIAGRITSNGTFLSTLSLRRATDGLFFFVRRNKISIHALLAESDKKPLLKRSKIMIFLSTLSLRRATARRIRAE